MDGYRRIIPLTLVLVLTGCGSGALSGRANTAGGPTPPTTTTNTTQLTTPPDPTTTTSQQKKTTAVTTKRQYGWSLPEGPRSPASVEDFVYLSLAARKCDEAQRGLDEAWRGLRTPRNAPLYQSAVDLCRGNVAAARSMFAKAAASGLQMHQGGPGSAAVDCPVLKSVRSVLDQVAQESVRCTPGTVPQWKAEDQSARDDPRTDVIEGTTTTSATTTTPTTASSS
jgi:hypothetical protein